MSREMMREWMGIVVESDIAFNTLYDYDHYDAVLDQLKAQAQLDGKFYNNEHDLEVFYKVADYDQVDPNHSASNRDDYEGHTDISVEIVFVVKGDDTGENFSLVKGSELPDDVHNSVMAEAEEHALSNKPR